MIRNYLKVAFRSLTKYKFYSAINILGLSLGIASVLLMLLYVQHELSYDRHIPNAENIYQVSMHARMSGQDFDAAVVSSEAGPAFTDEIPEVMDFGRMRDRGEWIVDYNDNKFKEEDLVFADQGMARLFNFDFVSGNPETALVEPYKLVITEEIATKYFGTEDPIGKLLKLDGGDDYEVTGVIKAIPGNTHFQFNMYASLSSLDELENAIWLSNNFHTYIQLQEGTNPAQVEDKFPYFIEKYIGPEVQSFLGVSLAEFESQDNRFAFDLLALTDIHLRSDVDGQPMAGGKIEYVWIFGGISIFILIIACINFMNLATARSANRAKEVGIRKTLGSMRKQLISQFLSEAFLLSIIAFFIGIALAIAMLEPFNSLTDQKLSLGNIDWATFIPTLLGIALLIGFLAGSYPAFYLSAFNPTSVLKGKLQGGMKHKGLRSALVVFQFACSIALIVCTLVVYQQMEYMKKQNLGYNQNQLVYLESAYMLGDQIETFKQEMLRVPGVESATIASSIPTPSSRNSTFFFPGANPDDPRGTSLQVWRVDFDYLETLQMNVNIGRAFDKELATDSAGIILNQAAMRQFQLTDSNVLGQTIGTFRDNGGDLEFYEVIGVVDDFIFESMHNQITPLVLVIGGSRGLVTFRIDPTQTSSVIAAMQDNWNTMTNHQPFSYEFMDDSFANVYESEDRQGRIFTAFAGLAILIACLGLFGLAAFTAEQRTKEIGVRKVLGASVPSLVMLLSREFIVLVSIAFVIASVSAGWLMHTQWLTNFQYHTTLSPWIFIVSGLVALAIAWLTMSVQSLRAATANPVKSLRSE